MKNLQPEWLEVLFHAENEIKLTPLPIQDEISHPSGRGYSCPYSRAVQGVPAGTPWLGVMECYLCHIICQFPSMRWI